MKIYYIPAKDKNDSKKSIQLNSISGLVMLAGGLAPKSIEVIERINDINGVREIRTVYGNSSTGGFGIKEILVVGAVAYGAYYVRKQFFNNQQQKPSNGTGIDMSLFDKSKRDEE